MAPTEGMTCQELVELVTMYIEMMLSSEERRRFETHLIGCQGCMNYLNQMRDTIHAVGTLREDGIPPETRDRLLDAFRDWKRRA